MIEFQEVRYTTSGGRDLVSGLNLQVLPGETLVLTEIEDTGPGLAEEVLPRVFDPFFSTKPVGEGTGLGLSIAKKIMDRHEGNMEIRNAPRGGALVTLALKAERKELYEQPKTSGSRRG